MSASFNNARRNRRLKPIDKVILDVIKQVSNLLHVSAYMCLFISARFSINNDDKILSACLDVFMRCQSVHGFFSFRFVSCPVTYELLCDVVMNTYAMFTLNT